MPAREGEGRDAIVRAARELFAARGSSDTSVEDICSKAGVDKQSFRDHFDSKHELLKSVIHDWSEAHLSRLHEVETQDLSFAEKLNHLVEERHRLIMELGPLLRRELHTGGPELQRFVAERAAENRERFAAFLVAAQERGEVRRDVPPEVLLGMLEKLDEFRRDRALIEIAGDEETLTRLAYDVFFHGALAQT